MTLPAWNEITESETWDSLEQDEREKVFQSYSDKLSKTDMWGKLDNKQRYTVFQKMKELGDLGDAKPFATEEYAVDVGPHHKMKGDDTFLGLDQHDIAGLKGAFGLSPEDMKGFRNTMEGYANLAENPMGISEGGLQFVTALPGFGLGILNAGRAILDAGLDKSKVGYLSEPMRMVNRRKTAPKNLSELYDIASQAMEEGMKFAEPAMYKPKTEGAELVGATAMAPLDAIMRTGHAIADNPILENWPNLRGAIKFGSDAVALRAMKSIYHPKSAVIKNIEGINDSILADLRELQAQENFEVVYGGPDRPLKRLKFEEAMVRLDAAEKAAEARMKLAEFRNRPIDRPRSMKELAEEAGIESVKLEKGQPKTVPPKAYVKRSGESPLEFLRKAQEEKKTSPDIQRVIDQQPEPPQARTEPGPIIESPQRTLRDARDRLSEPLRSVPPRTPRQLGDELGVEALQRDYAGVEKLPPRTPPPVRSNQSALDFLRRIQEERVKSKIPKEVQDRLDERPPLRVVRQEPPVRIESPVLASQRARERIVEPLKAEQPRTVEELSGRARVGERTPPEVPVRPPSEAPKRGATTALEYLRQVQQERTSQMPKELERKMAEPKQDLEAIKSMSEEEFVNKVNTVNRMSEILTPEQKLDLTPAIVYKGKVVKAKEGEIHAALMDRVGAKFDFSDSIPGFITRDGEFVFQAGEGKKSLQHLYRNFKEQTKPKPKIGKSETNLSGQVQAKEPLYSTSEKWVLELREKAKQKKTENAKETWEMTQEDYLRLKTKTEEKYQELLESENTASVVNHPFRRLKAQHEIEVTEAKLEGKKVPENVLKEYPDLLEKADVGKEKTGVVRGITKGEKLRRAVPEQRESVKEAEAGRTLQSKKPQISQKEAEAELDNIPFDANISRTMIGKGKPITERRRQLLEEKSSDYVQDQYTGELDLADLSKSELKYMEERHGPRSEWEKEIPDTEGLTIALTDEFNADIIKLAKKRGGKEFGGEAQREAVAEKLTARSRAPEDAEVPKWAEEPESLVLRKKSVALEKLARAKVAKALDAIGRERLEQSNIMEKGESLKDWLRRKILQKSSWSKDGRKTGFTGIQELSTKNLWGDSVEAEAFRKAALKYVKNSRREFFETQEAASKHVSNIRDALNRELEEPQPAEVTETVITKSKKKTKTDMYDIELSEQGRQDLIAAYEEVMRGEEGKRLLIEQKDKTRISMGQGSTYPDWMSDKWLRSEVLPALKKASEGKRLTWKQKLITEDALEYSKSLREKDKFERERIELEQKKAEEEAAEVFDTPLKTPKQGNIFDKLLSDEGGGISFKTKKGWDEAIKKTRDDYLTPEKNSTLDKASTAFLRSGKIESYVENMPTLGGLTPKQVMKYGKDAEKIFATRKGGKPAIRQSGFYVPKDFADAFKGVTKDKFTRAYKKAFKKEYEKKYGGKAPEPGMRDLSPTDPMLLDPTRMIEKLDQGIFGGPAQRYILWPTRRNTIAKQHYVDGIKTQAADILDNNMVKSKKSRKAVSVVSEFMNSNDVNKSPQNILKNKKIQMHLSKFNDVQKINIVRAAQETRKWFDKLIKDANSAREKRGQPLIDFRQNYLPRVREQTLVSRLTGLTTTTKDLMQSISMPDFIKPNKPFVKIDLPRTKEIAEYKEEKRIDKLMSGYAEAIGKDIFDTNTIHNNKVFSSVLRDRGFKNAADGIDKWTSEAFAGVRPTLQKAAYSVFNERGVNFGQWVRRNLTRAVFPLNVSWNVFVQTSSSALTMLRYGARANVAGLNYFLDRKLRQEIKSIAYSHIMKNRFGGSAMYQDLGSRAVKIKRLDATKIEKAEHFASYMTTAVESALTGHAIASALWHGKNIRGLKGRKLWEYASNGGAKTQSMYNYQDVPGILRNRVTGTVAPFQTFALEVFNTMREMEIPGFKTVMGRAGEYQTLSPTLQKRLKMFAEFTAAMMVLNAVGDKAIGRKPWQPSSFIPFLSVLWGYENPRSPVVPKQYLKDFWDGASNVWKHGNFDKLRSWMFRYQVYGGVQADRMVRGVEAAIKGEVTNVEGDPMFKVEGDTEKIKAIFLGPYRTEEGKEYVRARQGRGKKKSKKKKTGRKDIKIY